MQAIKILVLFSASLSTIGLSANDEATGPHGGKMISVQQGSFEVVVDPKTRRVDLFALKEMATTPPKEIGLRLKTPSQKTEIRLRTADPWRGLPHFEGVLPHSPSLHPGLSSSKGLDIELDF